MSDPKKIDRADIVNALWPMDGPHTAESVIAAADTIEDLWRYLAHATRRSDSGALAAPADVYVSLSRLVTSVRSAEQVFSQLARWADRLQNKTRLAHDGERSGDHWLAINAAAEAAGWLSKARAVTELLGRNLDQANSSLSHLYIDADEEEDQ
ncbi:MAG: hypothetical protein JWN03_6681 [Nocardia sp.]|uniref:hypothetical protein n=1 Tax=Nocardia sp. TaxID=1821 RepID=UPI002616C2D2|nr:hypothetical protein [Nocardia sp.]MCU1646406.1 hypothetical protein [Nocardia sp.]